MITDITTENFKSKFAEFPYLPIFDSESSYNTDEEVYYTNRLFYTALKDEVTSIPTTQSDWVKTDDNIENYIADSQIDRALSEAVITINTDLFSDETYLEIAFLYLSAHFLCLNTRVAMQAIMSKPEFSAQSKGVGGVSESYAIPDEFLKDSILNYYTKTGYGLKYLSMITPMLRGNIGVVEGWTQA